VTFCDFCHAPDPPHVFPCRDFVAIEAVPMKQGYLSRGDWMACDVCADLIREDDREGLILRAVVCYLAAHPEMGQYRGLLEEQLQQTYAQFWDMRLPVTEEES